MMNMLTLHEVRQRAEREHIEAVLTELDGNVSRAAKVLDIERTNLHKRMRVLGIRVARFQVEVETP